MIKINYRKARFTDSIVLKILKKGVFMKRNMKKAIALLLVLILVVSILTACGGNVSGKYTLKEMSWGEEGKLQKWEDIIKELKEDVGEDFDESKVEFYLEFLKDSKFKMVSSLGSETQTEEGTFKVDGKTITLTNPSADEDNKDLVGTIDGSKITFVQNGMTLVFGK